MEIRPRAWPGVAVGGLGTLLLVGVAVSLVVRVSREPISLVSFVAGLIILGLFVGAGLFLYWTVNCATLRYHLDRNRLAIRWGWETHVVPLPAIKAVLPGASATGRGKFRGVSWLGHHVGHALVEGVGETVFLSAHLLSRDLLYIVTPSLAYAISVPDPQRFAVELRLRQLLGANETFVLSTQRPPWYDLPLWRDGVAYGLLLLGVLGNAVLFAYLCYTFPSLPDLLPMRFTTDGVVEQIGLRNQVLLLPAVSLGVLMANAVLGALLYRRDRAGAYFCLGAAVLVQGLMGAAILRIVG